MKQKKQKRIQAPPKKKQERTLDQLTPLDLEHFRVTQPTEQDLQEELDILRGRGYSFNNE
jgi:hypothetical protein